MLESNLPLLSPGHLLGTDLDGNDVAARLCYGGRTSLLIAAAVNVLGLLAGGTLGALAAYVGGVVDSIVMRLVDAATAFPALVLVIAIAQGLGPGAFATVIALVFFAVPAFARVARAATLRLCAQPFMLAASLCGLPIWRALATHVVPNVLPPLIACALLGTGGVMMLDGALSFLGFGIALPQPTWGNMIFQGRQALAVAPRLVIAPGALLFVTVLSLNLLAEALRYRGNVN